LSAEQGKFAGQRTTFYHCATQPTSAIVAKLDVPGTACFVYSFSLCHSNLTAIIQSRQLTLFRRIMHTDDNADAKTILLASPLADWRRQPDRPRITWLSTVQQDL